MAKVFLKDFFIKNTASEIVAVSWQISTSRTFGVINNESIFDTENILSWDVVVRHYATGEKLNIDNIDLYARVKIYTRDMGKIHESDWYAAKLIDPTNGESDLTYDGNIIGRIKKHEDGTYTPLY